MGQNSAWNYLFTDNKSLEFGIVFALSFRKCEQVPKKQESKMQKGALKHSEIKSLGQLRDEVKVHAHLFKADMKDEWKRIEGDWRKLQSQFSPAKRATKKSASDVKAATRLLLKTVKRGYEQIKRSLPS